MTRARCFSTFLLALPLLVACTRMESSHPCVADPHSSLCETRVLCAAADEMRVAPEGLELIFDTNGDGRLEAGEEGQLRWVWNSQLPEDTAGPLRYEIRIQDARVLFKHQGSYAQNPVDLAIEICGPCEVCNERSADHQLWVQLSDAFDAAGFFIHFENIRDANGRSYPDEALWVVTHSTQALLHVQPDIGIEDDSNENGRLNPGEYAKVRWTLANRGTREVVGPLRFALEIENSDVTWRLEDEFDQVPTSHQNQGCAPAAACRESRAEDYVWVHVPVDHPANTALRFRLHDMEDGAGNAYPDVFFSVPVHNDVTTLALYPNIQIQDDDNGNGRLNPGEAAKLRWTLRNTSAFEIPGPIRYLARIVTPQSQWRVAGEFGNDPTEHEAQYCDAQENCAESAYRDYLQVLLASSHPTDTPLQVELFGISDGLGRQYPSLSFAVPVEAQETLLRMAGPPQIQDDTNDNHALNPGESARVRWTLENMGETEILGPLRYLARVTTPGVMWKVSGDWGDEYTEHEAQGCEPYEPCRESSYRDFLWLQLPADFDVQTPIRVELFDVVDGLQQPHPPLEFVLPVSHSDTRLGLSPDLRIQQDNDGNADLNPGESAIIRWTLRNMSDTWIPGTIHYRARVHTSGVTWQNEGVYGRQALARSSYNCLPYTDCQESAYFDHIRVLLDDGVPGNSFIRLELFDIEDALGVAYPSLQFSVPVTCNENSPLSCFFEGSADADSLSQHSLSIPNNARIVHFSHESISATDPEWTRPDASCQPNVSGTYFFDAHTLHNTQSVPVSVRVRALWQNGNGFLHAYRHPFQPFFPATLCLSGNDDANGPHDSELPWLQLQPGERVVIVASTHTANDTIAAYTLQTERWE